MREYRGNTAVAVQLEQPKVAEKKKRTPLRSGLPAGEKMLYLFSVVICVAVASLVLSRYAVSTELNMEIQKMEQEAMQLQEVNRQLEMEREELSSGERIRRFAEDNGLILMEKEKPVSAPSQQETGSGMKPDSRDGQG